MQALSRRFHFSPRAPRALVRLSARSFDGQLGLKVSRLYAFGAGLTYAITAWFSPGDLQVTLGSWHRALATASWVAGVGALSLARNLPERDAESGLLGLARLRGFGVSAFERGRALAGCWRLSTVVAVAGLFVALSAGIRFASSTGLWLTAKLAIATIGYAAVVGSALAWLARACGRTLPTRGRSLFLLVTLGPWLLSAVLGSVPNVPGAFAWLLRCLTSIVQ